MWDIREAALNRYGVHVGKRQDYALPCSGNERRRETAETLSRSTIADVSSNILELEDAFLPPLPLPEGGDAVVRIPSVSNNAGGNVENAVGAQQANGDDFQIGQFVFNDNLDEGVRLVSKLQHGPPLDENLPGAATRSRRKAVRVLCIARCPRGGHFATGADDGLCRVWSEEDGEVIAKIDSQCMGATALPEQRSAERRSVRVQQQQSEGKCS
jgi:WD40 repeat protein